MNEQNYSIFLEDIKKRIYEAQFNALSAVNKALVLFYWDLGKLIAETQEAQKWGKSVVERLSKDLRAENPNAQGFSQQNLWNMRMFYLAYKNAPILQTLSGEIGWSQNVLICSKGKTAQEQQFYMTATKKFGWTVRVLQHHIDNKTYEKYLLNQTNFDAVLPADYKHQAILAVKDHYTFSFLNLTDEHSEYELEQALIRNIRSFLQEMGNDYAFLGNQFKLEVEGEEYFIDMLLFHRRLQCLVAIELKIGDFKPEYKGKMEFYLEVLNDTVRLPHENAAIGIIICRNKKRTIVEYSLKTSTSPIGVASYSLVDTLPENYKNYLPTIEQINAKIDFFVENR